MAAPIITPPGPVSLRGKQAQTFTSDQIVTWSSGGATGASVGDSDYGVVDYGVGDYGAAFVTVGTLSDIQDTSVLWTAPNVTGTYTLTATNGASESTIVTIAVVAVFPAYWSYQSPATHKKKVLLFEPESGPRIMVQKRGRKATYELTGVENTAAEYLEIETFWDQHHPGKQFYFHDLILDRESLYICDSDLKYNPSNGYNRLQWAGVITEV